MSSCGGRGGERIASDGVRFAKHIYIYTYTSIPRRFERV